MAEYKNTFSDKTYNTLQKKSAESLKQMLKGKSVSQAMTDTMRLLPAVQAAEKPFKDYLVSIAEDVIKGTFPIIEQTGIKLDIDLVDFSQLNLDQQDSSEPDDEIPLQNPKSSLDKRRIINGITQGASIRGTKSYYLFKELIDLLDETLIERYNKILDYAYGIYDDDDAIAFMMAMLSTGGASQGGESEATYDEESDTLTVKARAVIFPILIHEIVKGLYEILSLQGFSGDAEQNKYIAKKVDKTTNEPEDLRYGKFIYDAINNILIKTGLNLPDIRELFFIEIYKLDDDDFKSFIENAINEELTPLQEIWVEKTLKRIRNENK